MPIESKGDSIFLEYEMSMMSSHRVSSLSLSNTKGVEVSATFEHIKYTYENT